MKEAVKIAGALLNTVTPRNNTKPKVFSPADGQQISSTLMSVTKNPDFITTDSAVKKKPELNSSKKNGKTFHPPSVLLLLHCGSLIYSSITL